MICRLFFFPMYFLAVCILPPRGPVWPAFSPAPPPASQLVELTPPVIGPVIKKGPCMSDPGSFCL